jgi:hypothetical protein
VKVAEFLLAVSTFASRLCILSRVFQVVHRNLNPSTWHFQMPESTISVLLCTGRSAASDSLCKGLRIPRLAGLPQSRCLACKPNCDPSSLSPTHSPFQHCSAASPQLRCVGLAHRLSLLKPIPSELFIPTSPSLPSISRAPSISSSLHPHRSHLPRNLTSHPQARLQRRRGRTK